MANPLARTRTGYPSAAGIAPDAVTASLGGGIQAGGQFGGNVDASIPATGVIILVLLAIVFGLPKWLKV